MPRNSEDLNKLKKKRFLRKRVAEYKARLDSKSDSITKDLLYVTAEWFHCENPGGQLAQDLALEHSYFENAMSPEELEQKFSHKTVVGIGQETRGRNKGYYPMVLNLLKTLYGGSLGLGFPGGRVRLGETPVARLAKEYLEETNLIAEIINPDGPPVSEQKVGEEGHKFLIYGVRIIGGTAKPTFTKDEQIVDVVFVDEETLVKLCRVEGGRIKVSGRLVGILRSHRLGFLEYLDKREKGALNV